MKKQPDDQPLYDAMQGPIRLACLYCDDDAEDGISAERVAELTDWHDIGESASSPDARWEWWTHLGTCPDCWAAGEGR